MSFRIGLLKNGELKTVYCAYPKNVLTICELLKNNYSKQNEVENLIELGDIHSIKENVEVNSYYGRDKGENIEDCGAYVEKADDIHLINTFRSPVDYYLIWTNKWNICKSNETNWVTINKFLNKHKR